jgi:hypothetical protein
MTRIIKSLPFPGHPREMKNIYPFAKGCQRKKGFRVPCNLIGKRVDYKEVGKEK